MIDCHQFNMPGLFLNMNIFAYAVRITSMILHTARFLCVVYTEICVNATTAHSSF